MNNKKTEKITIIAGIDDATKCPCIGSIFLAGVVATEKTIKKWKKLGVKDSKLITAKKREKLAKIIKETAEHYTIHDMPPCMIDDKTINLNAWEMVTMIKIVQDLQQVSKLQAIYIDNWEVTEKVFKERFLHLITTKKELFAQHNITMNATSLLSLWLIPEHHADENHIVVGAASILAKVASDNQYAEYKKEYGNFGSGSPGDPQTRLFVWQHRHNPPPIVRTSWQTYKTLSQLDAIEDDFFYAKKKLKKASGS
jgi:ribonuclease HII